MGAPIARNDRIAELYESGLSMEEVGKVVAWHPSRVRRYLKKYRPELIRPAVVHGSQSHFWKGGRRVTSDGYIAVMVDPSDPYAWPMRSRKGYVLEHRVVMAHVLKRSLLKSETVHHIDGDRSHNAPTNLQLRQGNHGKHVVMQCCNCGSFNVMPTKIAEKE